MKGLTEVDPNNLQIGTCIGRGTFGEVCKGTYNSGGEVLDVAIKVMRNPYTPSSINEILSTIQINGGETCRQIAAQQQGRNPFVCFYDVIIDTTVRPPNLKIIMELLSGFDLANFIKSPHNFDAKTAIARMMCESLNNLFKLGFVHNDIKTENIWIEFGQDKIIKSVKIIDYGFSCTVESCRAFISSGSPQYIFKEKLDLMYQDPKNHPANHMIYAILQRNDIWALGLCIFELFNVKLFLNEARTVEQLFGRIKNADAQTLYGEQKTHYEKEIKTNFDAQQQQVLLNKYLPLLDNANRRNFLNIVNASETRSPHHKSSIPPTSTANVVHPAFVTPQKENKRASSIDTLAGKRKASNKYLPFMTPPTSEREEEEEEESLPPNKRVKQKPQASKKRLF